MANPNSTQYHADFDCTPAQYHGMLSRLWAATGIKSHGDALQYAAENDCDGHVVSIVESMLAKCHEQATEHQTPKIPE